MTPKQIRQHQREAMNSVRAELTPVSYLPSNDGTDTSPVETISAVVIGADTLVMPTTSDGFVKKLKGVVEAVMPKDEKFSDKEYACLPYFQLRYLGCCGLAEVAGIHEQLHDMSDRHFTRVICGLEYSRIKHIQEREKYKAQVKTFADIYAQNNAGKLEGYKYAAAQSAHANLAAMWKLKHAGQYIFSYTTGNDEWWKRFGDFVEKNKIGEVYLCPKTFFNPNSFHQVRTVLYSVDYKNFVSFYQKYMTEEQLRPGIE